MRTEIRLAVVWFLYMAGFGLYFPYWSLYLTENAGLANAQAGIVIGALSLMGIVSQPFWGQIADRTGSRTRVLGMIVFGASCGYLLLGAVGSFSSLVVANAFFASFHTAVIPMMVAVNLAILADRSPHAFGIVRSVGTVGFLVLAWTFPRVLDAIQESRGWIAVEGGPSEPGLELMFRVSASFALLAALFTLSLPRTGAVSVQAERGDWRALGRHRPYGRLIVVGICAYLFTHGPMLFFPKLVTHHGGDLQTISNMWVPMIALEIPLLALAGVMVDRLGPRGMIAIGLGAAAVRWLLCGFTPSLEVIFASCLLHGVTVGCLMMGSPFYVEAVVPDRLRATGQGLLATSAHLGAMLSSMSTGVLSDAYGIEMPFRVGGILALVLALSIFWILPEPHRPEEAG